MTASPRVQWPDDLAREVELSQGRFSLEKTDGWEHRFDVFKAADSEAEAAEERTVFGAVLIPEVRDSQGDIYSAREVEKAAHRFLAGWREKSLGEQHEKALSEEDAQLLESYVAPADFTIAGRRVKAGTWLMKWKIHSDVLWKKIKDGLITGFSIGGSAIKMPG